MRRLSRISMILAGSVAGLAAALLVVVLAAGGVFAPASYLDPWEEDYSVTFVDPRMKLVSQAVLAPSSHNEQPWRVRLDADDDALITLYADSSRLTPEVDPLARQSMISQGTFIAYLRVASERAGLDVAVDLFPDGQYDESDLVASMGSVPVAEVRITPRATADSADFESMFRSDTNRSPYEKTPVTDRQADEIEALASEGGPTLSILRDPGDVAALRDATVRGSVIESENASVAAESAAIFRPNEYRKNETRSGFAVEGQGTSGFMKYLLQGVTTLLPSTNDPAAAAVREVRLATEGAAATPAYATIQTAANSRLEQVQAGILYGEFSLRARTMGLVVQPVSQILEEYPSMSEERSSIHEAFATDGSTIQMLVRLGTPTIHYPPSMRRNPNDLVITP